MSDNPTRRLQAILAADVVGYSRLMSRDEEGTLARLQALEREVLDPAIATHGGEIVKRLGDGVLAVFPSAVTALRAARAIREQAAQAQSGVADPIAHRIGLNVGDVIVSGNDIFGEGVNIAARLEGLADPGGIVLSSAVHDHVRAQDPGPFDDLGEQRLKNIDHPVRVYRVRYPDSPPRPAPGTRPSPARIGLLALLLLGVGATLTWWLWPEEAPPPAAHAPPPGEGPADTAPSAVSAPAPAPKPTSQPRAPAPVARAEPAVATPATEPDRPASGEAASPDLGERLLDNITQALEKEFAGGESGGASGKNRVPPGKARKEKNR